MASNESSTPASRPSQKSSRASSSPGTGRNSPVIENDSKNGTSRPINPSMPLVTRLSTPVSLSASGSPNNSTNSSRETSPIRLTSRVVSSNNQSNATRSLSRHKNNLSPSPSRGVGASGTGSTSHPATVSSTLSPSTVQKAFAQLNKPDLQSSTSAADKNIDVADLDRSSMPPPPTSRRRSSNTNGSRSPSLGNTTSKRSETSSAEPLANISTKRSSVSPEEGRVSPVKTTYEDGEHNSRRPSGWATAPTGTMLETVQESSVPSTPVSKPAISLIEDASSKPGELVSQAVESGSESGGNKSSESKEEKRRPSTSRPASVILPQRSFTSLNNGRGKPSDGLVRNMIVETETVSSIPQVSLGVGAGERGNAARNDQGGTIRMKPSTETIRPRKEKKKTTRKPTNLPNTASSKADIFEAKVASAIDDADVSDSDETFVYESNPPEPLPTRHRYHSRTPSATSMASQAEQFTGRARLPNSHANGVNIKRSMKFTNNHNTNLDSDLGDIDQRSASGRGDSNGHSGRHHHIGRHGRGGTYPSLFDSDSPFPQSQQPRSPRHYIGNGVRQGRRGNMARSHPSYRTIGGPKSMSDDYPDDFDADGADDERTPLVSSIRQNRNRNGRRPGSASLRQMEYLENRHRNCFTLYGGCVIALLLILILIGGAATFLLAMMRPLLDVQVTKLSNVLASEQEIMLDVQVSAINPNIFPISIANMDVNVFARSRYVGSDRFWRDHGPHSPEFPRPERSNLRARLAQLIRLSVSAESEVESESSNPGLQVLDGVDHGTDPIDDPSNDAQTMLLGRVFSFDSPVILDPSPWRRLPSDSVGEIRLAKPGNKTEEGGTERWERVLQHPFELIVRGVFKYSLPLASGERSASISAKVQFLPDEDSGDDDNSTPFSPSNETIRIKTIDAASDLEKDKRAILVSRTFSS